MASLYDLMREADEDFGDLMAVMEAERRPVRDVLGSAFAWVVTAAFWASMLLSVVIMVVPLNQILAS